jgi:hypothetical protein
MPRVCLPSVRNLHEENSIGIRVAEIPPSFADPEARLCALMDQCPCSRFPSELYPSVEGAQSKVSPMRGRNGPVARWLGLFPLSAARSSRGREHSGP